MSEWTEATLDEVMDLDIAAIPVDPARDYSVVGVLNRGRGLLFRDAMAGANTQYKTLNRIGPDQVVFSRLKAFEGAITVAPGTLGEAYASQEFPTFTCRPALLLPEYFRLVTTTKRLWDDLQNLSTGMGGRRERVKPSDFLTIKIILPSIAEQRRIVDVMAALDAQVEVLAGESQRAWAVWRAAVAALDEHRDRLLLADGLRSIEAGKSPKGEDRIPGPNERAVLKVSAVGRARFVPAEVKTVEPSTVLPEATRVHAGDVLLVRCNAVLDRVGSVCRVPMEPENVYLCDKTLRLVPKEEVLLPNYLVHAMAAPSVREQIATRTAGSDMRNIGQAALRELAIPDPGIEVQALVGRALDGIVAAALAAEAELANLGTFRATLLTNLLNREIEIPESYDDLLKVVS